MMLLRFATIKPSGEIMDVFTCSSDVAFLQRKENELTAVACPENVYPYSHYYDFSTDTFVEFEREPAPPGSPLLGDHINPFTQAVLTQHAVFAKQPS